VGIGYSDGGSKGVEYCSAYGLHVICPCCSASVGICLLMCKAGVGDSDREAVAGRGRNENMTCGGGRVGDWPEVGHCPNEAHEKTSHFHFCSPLA